MARRPKPWWFSQVGEWAVTIDGQRHRLGPDKEAAEKKFHDLMARPTLKAGSIASVVELFLQWTEKHRAPLTLTWYRQRLQSFIEHTNKNMCADLLRAHHVEDWIDSHKNWGDSHRRGAMTAIDRCLNWAAKKGHIERNPIKGKLDKPAYGTRDVVLSPTDFKKLLKHLTGDFRDLIVTAWETGARPQELTKVERRHVDLANGRWAFPKHEAKGKKKERHVYLSKPALAITKRLMMKYPKGPLFRRNDVPWDRFMVSDEFDRLKEEIGFKYRLYDWRHSYITNALKNGVDPITLQHLVGHKDLSMISRVYAKVQQDIGYMRRAASKAVQ